MEPVAEVTAAGRSGRVGQRGRYGIDGGFTGLAVFAVIEAGLDELGLRGDEHVLDVGCGRGAVLMLAARRLPAGRAVGADVWRRRDQSGNSRAAAERNAAAEGVAGRVELVDADARDLPFEAASFDVVVSSLAISNIRDAGGRAQALREAVRVVRPGGRLRIVDDGADRYAIVLLGSGKPGGCAALAATRAPGHEPHDDEDGHRDQSDDEERLERGHDPARSRDGKPHGEDRAEDCPDDPAHAPQYAARSSRR